MPLRNESRGPWAALFLVFAALLAGCDGNTYQDSARERLARAEAGRGDIVVGVAWDNGDSPAHLVEGVKLAAEEINLGGGILNGRKIRLIIQKDEYHAPKRLAANPNLVAVIGHRETASAMPASVTYSYHNILFLAPFSANIKLTQHGFANLFRTLPNNEQLANALARFCKQEAKYRKMVILHSREDTHEELGGMFYEAAIREEIEVVQFSSYFYRTQDFRRLIAKFKSKNFNAIFIADGYQSAGRLMRQVREMGINAPFVGSDALDTPGLLSIAGDAAEGMIVPTVFDPTTKLGRAFVEDFTFGYPELEPDTAAAQGYDALKLLAFAMEQSKTTIPIVVGNTLRYMPRWLGVTGQHLFSEEGEIETKQFVFKEMRNGRFAYLSSKARLVR